MGIKRLVPDWQLQLLWFVAGIFGTGALWYFLSARQYAPAAISAIAAMVLSIVAANMHRLNDRAKNFERKREHLGAFLAEANSLLAAHNGRDMPERDYQNWHARLEEYITRELDSSYNARLNDFSGMTFFSGGGIFRNAIVGHCQRLNEFIKELGP